MNSHARESTSEKQTEREHNAQSVGLGAIVTDPNSDPEEERTGRPQSDGDPTADPEDDGDDDDEGLTRGRSDR